MAALGRRCHDIHVLSFIVALYESLNKETAASAASYSPGLELFMFSRLHNSLCFTLLATVCGCGQTQSTETSFEPGGVVASTDAVAKEVVDETLAPEELAETMPVAIDQEPVEKEITTDYEPPYPDRVDLFLAPKREGRKSTDGGQEDVVELLGFVNVDSQQAVLMINGMVYSVSEGDTQFGVEVISIQPPAIVLQRGRQRWQASLDN
jgi:hypothetical protein